jgi:ribosomal protein S18 acetylase RimI-like enzyme
MSPVRSVGEVLDAIQKVKTGAKAFCTNFFPVQSKLESWVAHDELTSEACDGVTFFLRKDRDFAHLYFSAAAPAAFGREIRQLATNAPRKLSTDIVGPEASLTELLDLAEQSGFRRYSRLVRLARVASTVTPPSAQSAAAIELAASGNAPEILGLIEGSFDRFADQLPTLYEIEAAIAARQILLIKHNGDVAALLFFETQGLTSTIRYWLVAEQFHSRGFGSTLIRHYFANQPAVRRFTLWVRTTNENAIQKYAHYGYAPDGLVDHVLLSEPAPT